MAKMRPQVRKFAQRMEARLAEHDEGKGLAGWQGKSASFLLRRLVQRAGNLASALPSEDAEPVKTALAAECVNVANIAMIIADLYGD